MLCYETLATHVDKWRTDGYPCADFPALAEILDYAKDPETGNLRFLRSPQLRALETYWYLRLVEKTPHIYTLYRTLFSKTSQVLDALGLKSNLFQQIVMDDGLDTLIQRIKTDDTFVATHKLEALRETLTLPYASYILALAMGAGKTILIGAVIATEFAMAMEYPDANFVQNALVFAPGTTIVQALREIAQVPYDRLLPPRLYAPFAVSVSLTFTRDGEKDIPIVRGSRFNIVVTNTEKIRIQKSTGGVRAGRLGQLKLAALEQEQTELANLRLQAIASLPQLAVFSDEAHHTFGQEMGKDIKRVRQTINYLYDNSPSLVCVVNTTGTPYFEKQPLKDVVIWYGLSQGIKDGILKDVKGNVKGYGFTSVQTPEFIHAVVTDFFQEYANVSLPNGAPAKIALYFPQNDDLNALRPAVEMALAQCGQPPTIILKNTSESTTQEVADFNSLNDPGSLHRVILLVNKGTEGWNCPSLFACALARKLSASNNFVLQAATRCLRQVPGNTKKARIYLSQENRALLDTQLRETYGETLADLSGAEREAMTWALTLQKPDVPPLSVTQTRRRVVQADAPTAPLVLTKPDDVMDDVLTTAIYTPAVQAATKKVLQQVGETEELHYMPPALDCYTAASDLTAVYRLPFWTVYAELVRCYGEGGDVPPAHLSALAKQIESQTRAYEVQEFTEAQNLQIIKASGFDRTEAGDYVTHVTLSTAREALLLAQEDVNDNSRGFGFHYTPYNFDSEPERSFFVQMLTYLNLHPDDVEDIYFTGAFTGSDKTDFFAEYQDAAGKWRNYTPDFLIRRKDGRALIVEVKASRYDNDDPNNADGPKGVKARAIRRWEAASPDQIKYEMCFAVASEFTPDELVCARRFVDSNGEGK